MSNRPVDKLAICCAQLNSTVGDIAGNAEKVRRARAEAAALGADLVVMGRNSRYEPKDLILGSVSYRVARHARVPVLLVP